GVPLTWWALRPSLIMPTSKSFAPSSQRYWRPLEQYLQRPQLGRNDIDTWSPGFTLVTPGPTSSTTPAPSWPPMTGSPSGMSPVTACSSEWHMPATFIETSTSPCLGSSSSTSSIFQSSPTPQSTAARVVVGMSRPPVQRTCEVLHHGEADVGLAARG